MSCGVGHRCDSDPTLLWLWCRKAAIALIWALIWELPHAVGMALKRPKTKQNKTKKPTKKQKPLLLFLLNNFIKLLRIGCIYCLWKPERKIDVIYFLFHYPYLLTRFKYITSIFFLLGFSFLISNRKQRYNIAKVFCGN